MIKDGDEEQVRAGWDLSAQVVLGAFCSASPEMCGIVWSRGPRVHGERFGTGSFMPCRLQGKPWAGSVLCVVTFSCSGGREIPVVC